MKMSAASWFATMACLFAGASVIAMGCGSPGPVGGQGNPSSGAAGGGIVLPNAGVTGTAASTGSVGGAAGTPGAAGDCGTTTVKTSRAPSDMLIVLDRSLSMTYSTEDDCTCGNTRGGIGQPCANSATCTDRWTAVKTAVAATVAADSSIAWGLEFFASPTASGGSASCSVANAPQVPIGANNGNTIQSQIAAASPGSYTPTAAAIDVATSYLKTVNDGNSKAILLATDGEPNCPRGGNSSDDDLPGAVKSVTAAATAGFPVYVVGIGPQSSIANLNQLASAGGTGNYYPATSPQQLTDALSQIAKIVASCTFTSAQPPQDPSLVYVYVDKNLVQQSTSDGWSFGASNSTIELHGSYCDDFLSGKTSRVDIVFGCPGVPPTQIIP